MYVIVMKYVHLLCISLFFNNINCDHILINSENHELYQKAACTVECTSIFKDTLDNCYKNCTKNEKAAGLERLKELVDDTANIELICRNGSKLVLRVNYDHKSLKRSYPDLEMMYIIKVQDSKDQLREQLIYLSNEPLFTFENLHPNQTYNVSGAVVTSRWQYFIAGPKGHFYQFQTMHLYFKPGNINQISVDKFSDNPDNASLVDVYVSWLPNHDRTCLYDLFYYSTENAMDGLIAHPIRNPQSLFHYVIRRLRQDEVYNIAVRALNIVNKTRESELVWITMRTPTCNQIHNNNLTICPPGAVSNIRVNSSILNSLDKTFSIMIEWTPPEVQPDEYGVIIREFYYHDHPVELRIPGDMSQANCTIQANGLWYTVIVISESQGGWSKPTHEDFKLESFPETVFSEHEDKNSDAVWIAAACFGVLILFLLLLFLSYKAKMIQQEKDRVIFEVLEKPNLVSKERFDALVEKYNFDPKLEVDFKNVEMLEKLGEGNFGMVRRGNLNRKGLRTVEIAIKSLKVGEVDVDALLNEINTMITVGKHTNIVGIVGYCFKEHDQLKLLMEYCGMGNLLDFLRGIEKELVSQKPSFTCDSFFAARQINQIDELFAPARLVRDENINLDNWGSPQGHKLVNNISYDLVEDSKGNNVVVLANGLRITPVVLLSFARQVASGMEHLMKNKVIHRDLAARNVLVCKDLTLKIADFGLSRNIYGTVSYVKQSDVKVPIKWLAVESLNPLKQEYTSQSDVWSFGILLYEIVTLGKSPYPEVENKLLLPFLEAGRRMSKPINCSDELFKLMTKCWLQCPTDRPNFTDVLQEIDGFLVQARRGQTILSLKPLEDRIAIPIESYLEPNLN